MSKRMTVEELKAFALENGTYDDIFTYGDPRLPEGIRLLRPESDIQRWLDALEWETKDE